MGKCCEHAQAEHLSFAQAQAEHLQTRNGRVLLSIAQAEHLSVAQAQAEHLQNSLREYIMRFSQTIITPLADHFRSSLFEYCSLDPLGSCGQEDDRSCVVNQELVISPRVPTEHAHTFGECSN